MIRLCTALLFLLAVALPVSAATTPPASLKQVVAALESGYRGLQDVQADFTQSTTVVAIGRTQKGRGELLLKRPASAAAMFRFSYSKPPQQIVSNGSTVWFYTPAAKQVLVSSVAAMSKGGYSIALSYLTGLGNLSHDFTVAFARQPQDSHGNYQLELTPKVSSAILAKLQITVPAEVVEQFAGQGNVKGLFPVLASTVYDGGGNSTRIDYSRVRVNRGIDNGKFNFRIPAGVEVIKP